MPLTIGDNAPDFEADTTIGKLRFHEWLGNSWGVFFSHPKDFTPVCTTELGNMAKLKPEFDKRGARIIGLSVDPVEKHALWSKDIEETQGHAPNYPMIGDPTLAISKLYGMLPVSAGDSAEGRTAADNQTVRSVFIIGPDKKIKLTIVYPMTTGRNFDEVLRVLDSLQLTAKYRVATPVNWQQGEDVIIAGSVTNDEAKTIYPNGWKSPKPYIRIVPQPASPFRLQYRKTGIATFDVSTETIFQYMQTGGHPHAALKRYELVSVIDNVVTAEADIYNADGSTFSTTIRHRLNEPKHIETTMTGGAFDGARFTQTYTTLGDTTRLDVDGDFPTMPGVSAADELQMIDGFLTMIYAEDTETTRRWSPALATATAN